MKEVEILRDLLQYRTASEIFYNDSLVDLRNPEVRQLFTQLRDDEMRAVVELQQRIERLETARGIIGKIIPRRS